MKAAHIRTSLACLTLSAAGGTQAAAQGSEVPLTVKLVAGDAAAGDGFGGSIAVHGDTAVIGAPFEEDTSGSSGSAYVFVRSGTDWSQQAKLVAADAVESDRFGTAVAVDGDTAVVGAPFDDDAATSSGSAYVFVRVGTIWIQTKLVATDAAGGDQFGTSVAVAGDAALIGAPFDSPGGSVYVFVRSGASWSQQAKVVAPDAAGGDEFGRAIAIDGDRMLIGAYHDNTIGGTDAGSAYVFVRVDTSWLFEAKLRAGDGFVRDEFGRSVALHGDRAVIGAPLDDDLGASSGSAYVFGRAGASWSQLAKLTASDAAAGDQFGSSVGLHGDTAVIGSPFHDDAGADSCGSAYVFVPSGTGWSQQVRLVAADAVAQGRLGGAVDADGDTTLVGAPGAAAHRVNAGAVYVSAHTPFPSFCDDADGSLAACPCSNPGSPDSGCDIAQGTGGVRLDVAAQGFLPQNRATLVGTGYPPASAPSAVVIRAASLDSAAPVVFGDGLRCIGTPLVRLGASVAVGGTSVHAIGHGAAAGTFYYQLWFRNQPAMFCTPDAFNLSNGRALAW